MKCIYSALRPPLEPKSYADWITKCSQKLSLSTKGLVAFTSSFCLNQPRPQSVSYHVYVADLNRPYKPYLLLECEHDITILEWDPSGSKLLICDSRGCATIFTSKDFLISDWKPYFEQKFAAESFIAACWYHPGIVSTINVANQNLKTSSNHLEYTDKIQQSKFAASLRLFGGKAAEGCILISRTGLICCLTLMADGTVDVVSESLNLLRMKLHVADVSYHPDGSFIIGASSGSINSTILFYKVNLSIKNITIDDVDSFVGNENKRVNVSCKQYYSFHLNVMSQILNERENASAAFDCVNHIKFVSKDSPNDVLIEVSGQNLSLIELWELETKRRNLVHSTILEIKQSGGLAQTNSIASKSLSHETINGAETTNPSNRQPPDGGDSNASTGSGNGAGGTQQTKEWIFKGNYINTEKNLVAIQVPKFKIFGSNRQLNVIFLAYNDSTIYGLRKEDLQPIGEPLDLSKDVMLLRAGGGGRNVNSSLDLDSKVSYKLYSGQNSRSGGTTAASIKSSPAVKSSLLNGLNNQNKQKPRVNYITDIQLSTNQTMFVAIDSMSQLHAVKLPPLITCQDSKDEETYLQYMLEYCLVTGNDWWDVLVCSSRDSIETICDKFHDAYERQPKHVQRKYFNRQLMIRASLYRCVNDAASLCKSSECHTMIMLNSISSTLKSMLRSQDQDSPADQLSSLLKTPEMQQNMFDCKKVLAKVNEKEFYVESHLIQCLQPLNQWVVDFATYLIASLPQNFKSATAVAVATGTPQQAQYLPGASLARNKEALEIVRELLIIIKIWGKLNAASLPVVYQLSDQIDVIGALFRLISICYSTLPSSANQQQTSEPEEQFINECVQFTNNITVTQFEYFLAATGVASPLLEHLGNGDTRLLMEYFQEPTLPELRTLDRIEGSINMNGSRKIDVIRNISLGAYPLTNVRHCTRCRAISLMRPSFNTSRAWEQRWMNTCVCGGHWAQSDGLCSNKISYLSLLYNTSTTGSLSQLANQLIR